VPKIRVSNAQQSSESASSAVGQKSTGRVLGNWLRAYAEYTAESESPESFHLWTGLSVLASAVRRNAWLNQGLYTLFPNLFVILVGPPGKVAKSTTIRLGRTLLYGVEGIKFGPDAVTVEELIRQLEKAGADHIYSALTIHSTELSDLIDPSGIKMIAFLTTIYDGDIKWEYATKGSGRNDIKNPVMNLLGGTTPDWIANGMPVQAIGHGFTSRVIFVYEDKPRHLNPFPEEPNRELVKDLINDLDHISRLKGEFSWDAGKNELLAENHPDRIMPAKEAYSKYYKIIYGTQPTDYRVEGYHWRKKNHLLKIAMLLSIAENDDLILRARDIEAAWVILEGTEKKMVRTFSAVGKYEHASDLERILEEIQDNGGMTAKEIYNRNYAAGSAEDIAKILGMLVAMGKITKSLEDRETWYRPKKR
jgi:hypothetical protein